MKQRGFKLAKLILNTIWGALCKRNKIKRSTFHGEINLNESDNIIHIQEINDFHRVEYTKQGKYFKHNYARLGVFLTAKTRCNLAEIVDKYPTEIVDKSANQILRCYTDSILSTMPLDIPISNKLGEWKLENSGKCIVKRNRKPNFIK